MTIEGFEDEKQPVDLLFETIPEWKPGTRSAEDIVGSVESKLGRPITGQERTDLLSLAGGELQYDSEQFGSEGDE